MNRSKIVALICAPLLTIAVLLSAYWIKSRASGPGAPLDLHAGVSSLPAPEPRSAFLLGTDKPSEVAPRSHDASGAIVPSATPESPATPPRPSIAIKSPAAATVPAPRFDVVRVEPSGEAVIAGQSEPDAQIAALANGRVIAEGQTDASGHFVLLPPPLGPGEYGLTLRVTPKTGDSVSSDQNVAVSVPAKGKGDVMVALAEPGKATVLLADPTAKDEDPKPRASIPAKPAEDPKPDFSQGKPEVAIKMVETVEPGGFFASGLAAAGARLQLYLNGSALAEVTAGADGKWSVKVGKGLIAGHYAVRADQLGRSGSVIARAEVPFDYVPAAAEKDVNAASVLPSSKAARQRAQVEAAPISSQIDAPTGRGKSSAEGLAVDKAAKMPRPHEHTPQEDFVASTSHPGSTAVIAEIQTATVDRGNSLWRISRRTLGHGSRYTEIYAANSQQIRDPRVIYPGQVFVIPGQTTD